MGQSLALTTVDRSLKQAQEVIRRSDASRSLKDFTLYTKPDYMVGWHHDLIFKTLDAVLKDPNRKRIMVFAPPRHGKSEIISRRFPAYYLGKNPDKKVIATSYSASLAISMSRDVQRIIDTPEYREIFPGTLLNSSNVKTTSRGAYKRTSDEFEIVNRRGAYKCAGVNGGITGQGADVAIIDDPCKDFSEAHSDHIQQGILDWYESTLYTRLQPDGKIIIVLTRWADGDLAGRLLKAAEEDPEKDQWEIISLPALFYEEHEYAHALDKRKKGEPLWPEHFTKAILKSYRATMSGKVFEALYQQEPNPEGGSIFDVSWFNYFKETPAFDYKVISWDLSFKNTASSDFIAGTVWGVHGIDRYLLWIVRKRASFTESITELCTLRARFPEAMWTVVEDKANGPAIIDTLKGKVKGLIAYNPTDSKEARAIAVSPVYEAGNVWLPDQNYEQNRFMYPWIRPNKEGKGLLSDFILEHKTFPGGKNDDMVDSAVQAMIKLGGVKTGGWLDEILRGNREVDKTSTKASNPKHVEKARNSQIANMMGWDTGSEHPDYLAEITRQSRTRKNDGLDEFANTEIDFTLPQD